MRLTGVHRVWICYGLTYDKLVRQQARMHNKAQLDDLTYDWAHTSGTGGAWLLRLRLLPVVQLLHTMSMTGMAFEANSWAVLAFTDRLGLLCADGRS